MQIAQLGPRRKQTGLIEMEAVSVGLPAVMGLLFLPQQAQHLRLMLGLRVAHQDFQQKTIHLRFG